VAPLRSYRRFLVVAWHFLPLAWAWARDRRRFVLFGRPRRVPPETHRKRAEKLLASLLTLGPTFIKLGQLLSTRPDVLPPEYIEELSELQDRVPPADWAGAREVLEAEVGPVDEAFDDFDREPISGASLGQVYTASHEGRDVAVKVRRPGVESLVEADLQVIKWLLPVVLLFVDDAQSYSVSNLADEFDTTINQEMDYAREADMLREIRGNFADDDRVKMPPVVDERSGETVLTMAYIPGTKITDVRALDAKGVDRTAVANALQRVYLQMMVVDGVFHADPHPGNLAVQDDGTIVFYDFGMSGRVDESVQDSIVDFYLAAASYDTEGILDALTALGTLSPEADRGALAEVLELGIQDARGEVVEDYRVQGVINNLEDKMYEFPFRLPRELALVLRVATVVEGVCVTLDPEFDFIEVATEFLTEQGFREEGVRRAVEDVGDQVVDASRSALRVPPKLERALDRVERENLRVQADISDPQDRLERLAKRVVYGGLLAAGWVSTTLVYVDAGTREAAVPAALTGVFALLLYRSFRDRKTFATEPQFTRQGLADQREGGGGAFGLDLSVDEETSAYDGEDGVDVDVEPEADEGADDGGSVDVDAEPEADEGADVGEEGQASDGDDDSENGR
jgi:predicted unusual protein kinase regulating ubiquinone biosynthesis (AarF/ABC1/UbiB family)